MRHLEQQTTALGASFTGWSAHHPVATTLLTLGCILLGVLAFFRLPVAPLPEAEYPTIQIRSMLPGASPETMASSVATPLEVAFSAIPGITEMTSVSSLGMTNITLQFTLEKEIDTAAQEVQAAINTAANRLPDEMPELPVWRKQNPNDSPLLVLGLQSDLMTLEQLSDAAETLLARRISQIQGVAETQIVGQRKPALRIQASPQQLAALGLSLSDIRAVVRAASVNQPKGALFGERRVSTLQANDQIFDPAQYEQLVVAWRDGSPVKLGDVARISFDAENDYMMGWPNGKPGVMFVIRRQPGANIVATADRVRAALPQLRAQLPASVRLDVLNDRTRTIRSSLAEVELTLVLAIGLVIVVMGLFLRERAATLIVSSVLAVSLVLTFAVMYIAGFSLNNLTLVALVIAVGFIVDDAIVVVENIHRHREAGASMMDAALLGTREIGFTVVTISLSLIAAFIPLLFMGGIVGRLFREFALTTAFAILVSVVACLTLAPMLASRFMKALPPDHKPTGFVARLIESYARGLDWALAHQRLMLAGFGVTLMVAVLAYVAIPKGFFPLQDTAFVVASTQAADDVSYDDMKRKHEALAKILEADPAVQSYAHAIGAGFASQGLSSGRFWISLKDRSDRDVSAEGFINRIRPQMAQVPGVRTLMRSSQDINLGGGGGSAQYLYVLSSADSELLSQWSVRLTEAMEKMPMLRDVASDQLLGASVTRLNIDRTAAARFGITTQDIDQLLYDAFGQRQIGEYQTEINQYKVVLEIDERSRGMTQALSYLHLRSPLTGEMVPLTAVAKVEPRSTGPTSITHSGLFPSVGISFNLAPGVALSDAVRAIRSMEAGVGMPDTITGRFQGAAQAFQDAISTQPLLILAALVAVYIILGVLYESFVHPLTILSTLPSAGLGALFALWLSGQDFSIMAMIGIVLLIGIVKKNGILMVDFAIDSQRTQNMSPQEAIRTACLVRFRPIMMTTLAALLGALPLVLAFGTGAELRQPLGIAVVGGLLLSQLLTLFSTPVVYLALDRLFHQRKREQAQVADVAAGVRS
jgi:HAE1 family hydrophobic/amphiphilic exporter-1